MPRNWVPSRTRAWDKAHPLYQSFDIFYARSLIYIAIQSLLPHLDPQDFPTTFGMGLKSTQRLVPLNCFGRNLMRMYLLRLIVIFVHLPLLHATPLSSLRPSPVSVSRNLSHSSTSLSLSTNESSVICNGTEYGNDLDWNSCVDLAAYGMQQTGMEMFAPRTLAYRQKAKYSTPWRWISGKFFSNRGFRVYPKLLFCNARHRI